jgi:hypothetical protein
MESGDRTPHNQHVLTHQLLQKKALNAAKRLKLFTMLADIQAGHLFFTGYA